MKLKHLFDQWGSKAQKDYSDKQWLLSKWEVNEGIAWPAVKTQALLSSLNDGLKPKSGDVLIELGCAGGWLLELLSPHVGQYFGLDFSMEMLKFASGDLKNNHLICGEIGRLPFNDEEFDRVLSYYVFMNFDDDAYVHQSLKEIYRVLGPGGRALIGQLPDREGSVRYEAAKEAYIQFCETKFKIGKSIREEFKPPLRLFSKEELSAFLNKEGVAHSFQDSFNPFFHGEGSVSIDWRFDLIMSKE